MSKAIPAFTEQQAAALTASQSVVDLLRAGTKDHLITYDATQDTHPNLVSMDSIWAELGFADHDIKFDRDGKPVRMHLLASYAEPERKKFDESWGNTFSTPEYAAHRDLVAEYVGKISIDEKGTVDHDDYTVYQVHEPDTVLHGLGIVVAARMTVKHGKMQIEPGSAMDGHVQVARDRLADAADALHPDDPEAAAGLVQDAATQKRQESIPFTSIEPVDGWRILDAPGAEALAATIRFALEHGETQPRDA